MKQHLPQWIRFPLWWLFKSPQRVAGPASLLRDLKGLCIVVIRYLFPLRHLEPVSVCVGLKDRSDLFLRCFLPSLAKCDHAHLLELSVFDCGSKDAEQLEKEVRSSFPGKVVFHSEPHEFSRAFAFNRAVLQSGGSRVFLCDADFSLPADLVKRVNQFTGKRRFWFPIVFYLYKNKPAYFDPNHGEWMLWGGKGIAAGMRSDYLASGGLDERFVTWGSEDEEFWLRLHQLGYVIVRTREKGLLHHWHPSLNPKYKKLEELSDMGLL